MDENGEANVDSAQALDHAPEVVEYQYFKNSQENHHQINMQTGELVDKDNNSSLGCVADERVVELYEIFSEAETCKTPEPEEDTYCTQIYRYPYAVLLLPSGEEIRLGEQVSGCASTTTLCGDKDEDLRNYIQNLIANADTWVTTCN